MRQLPSIALRTVTVFSLLAALAGSAAAALARVETSLGSCGTPQAPVGGSGGGLTLLSQELSSPFCYAYASAMQGPGYGSALASARMNNTDWSSGAVRADASAGFGEHVQVLFGSTPPDDLGGVFFRPAVSISGSVAAGTTTAAGALAQINYRVDIASSSFSGSMLQDSGGPVQQSGTFGFVELPEMFAIIGQTFYLSGSAETVALVNKAYAPLLRAEGSASADFSHTLRWLGVQQFQMVDSTGEAIATPEGFSMQLLGLSSGFDYFNAAPLPVPEPARWLLLAGGLLILRLRRP